MPERKTVPLYDHYHVTQQLGFRPILYCWCGARIDLNLKGNGRTAALDAFKRDHDACEMPREGALQAAREVI